MIPISHLSKMGQYDGIQIGGIEVEVRVVEDGKLLSSTMAELEIEGPNPIVGLDVKESSSSSVFGGRKCALLLLCTNTKCLIIQLERMRRKGFVPQTLKGFLTDKKICFVCPNGLSKKLRGLSFQYNAVLGTEAWSKRSVYSEKFYNFNCKNISVVEVGSYASRILKNPELLKCKSLEKLGSEARVDLTLSGNNNNSNGNSNSKSKKVKPPKWDSEVFSKEEVKYVVYDAVAWYRIVDHLLHGL